MQTIFFHICFTPLLDVINITLTYPMMINDNTFCVTSKRETAIFALKIMYTNSVLWNCHEMAVIVIVE